MRCSCCDRVLTEKEVSWNPEINNFEICTVCLDVALDAAYSNGFDPEDDMFVLIDDDIFAEDDYGYDGLYLPKRGYDDEV